MKSFNPVTFRDQFPAIRQAGIYLDSAATALKPQAMLDATYHYYHDNGTNINRGQYDASLSATHQFELVRGQVARLLRVKDAKQIIWTKGVTESINMVAQAYARPMLKPGDEILVSELEHHSNLIPWLIVAEQTGAKVVKLPIDHHYLPDLDQLSQQLNSRTKILAITQMSNVTGGQPDLAKIITLAHANNTLVMVDGAQGIVHNIPNLKELDVDFYAFSAHKLYGPSGLGVLYAKHELLAQMQVWHGGGQMLSHASFSGFTPLPYPQCFEAGTPNIAGVLGFGATLKWLSTVNLPLAEQYACSLAQMAYDRLMKIPFFVAYRQQESSILSFNITNHHHGDIAILLSQQGLAIRSGEHCAQPLMQALGVNGTLRVSFAAYNQPQDVDALVNAVKQAIMILELPGS